MERKSINQIFILDTSSFIFIFESIKENQKNDFNQFLDDLTTILEHKKIKLIFTGKVVTELSRRFEEKFRRKFNQLREHSLYWGLYNVKDNDELTEKFQRLFSGNIDPSTNERKLEETDHTLVIAAIRLASENQSIPVYIYSDDWQVIEFPNKLEELIDVDRYPHVEQISAFPTVVLTGFLRSVAPNLEVNFNFSDLDRLLLKKYTDYRLSKIRININDSKVVNHLIKYLDYSRKAAIESIAQLHHYQDDNIELKRKMAGLRQKNETLEDQLENLEESSEELIQEKIVVDDYITSIKEGEKIDKSKLSNFLIVIEYWELLEKRKTVINLSKYFRSWSKLSSDLNVLLVAHFRKKMNQQVFLLFLKELKNIFGESNRNEAWVLFQLMIPLTASTSWDLHEEELRNYYIIGSFLALMSEEVETFNDLIEILENNKDKITQSNFVNQLITFKEILLLKEKQKVTEAFIKKLMEIGKELYLNRYFIGAWYFLLPLWNLSNEEIKKDLKYYLERLYWATLTPPKKLGGLWDEINDNNSVTQKLRLGRSLDKTEELEIKKCRDSDQLPEFLKGSHLCINETVGRAHIVIHMATRGRRFGLEIQGDETNLKEALEIEFTCDSINNYYNTPKKDEERENLTGIIKLNKEPNIKVKSMKKNLQKLIVFIT